MADQPPEQKPPEPPKPPDIKSPQAQTPTPTPPAAPAPTPLAKPIPPASIHTPIQPPSRPAVPAPPKKSIKQIVIDSQIWRSMFRHGVWKDTLRDRLQHILGNVWLHLHPIKIPRPALAWTYTWGLGGASFLLFLILTVTGVLLMFYYRPTPQYAFQDMKDLEFAVSFGMFLRNMHRWAAHAMVVVVILHMVRVFLTGSYKSPREFNWAVGVVLLVLTLFLSFTGYLLPWDQLAIWAITVGSNMAANTPFTGAEGPFSSVLGIGLKNDARFALLGGTYVGENALLRFYVLHCIAVPFVAGILMIVHFWRVRKDTFSVSDSPYMKKNPTDKVEVWPHLIVREFLVAAGWVVFLTLLSIYVNAPLEEIANTSINPNPSKAPWYFTGLQELLVYFDPWIAGVALPTIIMLGLMAFPYIDSSKAGVGYYAWKERAFANTAFLFGLAMWFVLIYVGEALRGPDWAIYAPWESWSHHKPPPPATVNFLYPQMSELIAKLRGAPAETILARSVEGDVRAILLRFILNLPGAILLTAYFALGLFLPKLVKREFSWKQAFLITIVSGVVLCAALWLFAKMGLAALGWVFFSLAVYLIMGFFLPQKYIRNQPWVRYTLVMLMMLGMIGVILKMGLRLGFAVKYIISIPQFAFNI